MGFFRQDVDYTDERWGKLVKCDHPCHNTDRMRRIAKLSNLKPHETYRRLADIDPVPGNEDMLREASRIISARRGWLYIWGGPGNAKSEVLFAIVNECRAAGAEACYVTFDHLLNVCRKAAVEGEYADVLESYKNVQVLAIDEFDFSKVRSTEFVKEAEWSILADRWRTLAMAATIFASNQPPGDKGDDTDPLISRFYDGRNVIVENKAGDNRPYEEW